MGAKVFDKHGTKVRLDAISADPPKGVTREKKVKGKGRGDKISFVAVSAADLENHRGSRVRTGRVLQGSPRSVAGFAD